MMEENMNKKKSSEEVITNNVWRHHAWNKHRKNMTGLLKLIKRVLGKIKQMHYAESDENYQGKA